MIPATLQKGNSDHVKYYRKISVIPLPEETDIFILYTSFNSYFIF